MAIQLPVGFAQVAIEMKYSDDVELQYCTFGIKGTGPAVDAAQAIWDGPLATLAAIPTNDVEFLKVIVTTAVDEGESVGSSFPGLSSGPSLPSNCAYLIRKLTGARGREHQGRFYLPGCREDSIQHNGLIDNGAGFLDGIREAAHDFYTEVVALDEVDQVVILHNNAATDPTEVLDFMVQQQIGTQRRRMRP